MKLRRGVVLAALVAATGTAVGVALAGPGSSSGAKELLPDLDAAPPSKVSVGVADSDAGRRFRLTFASAADNVGLGPLTIRGERTSADDVEMTASQVIQLDDGSTTAVAPVGSLRYVVDPTHQHWHLLPFMRYELRSATGKSLVRRDRKTGFCLGDRYDTDPAKTIENEPSEKLYNTNCGLGETGLLTLEEGISPGWGDDYEPWRDGQFIDVTSLPAGKYVLIHRVNPSRKLRESSYANNTSSALIRITWPDGMGSDPRVRVLAVCPATATCKRR